MKKLLVTLSLCSIGFLNQLTAQALFAPITTTNYNTDGVAETTASSITTSSALDGSNYVLHTLGYAGLFSMSVGLPNNGLISSGSRTFQLQPYTQNNVCFLTTGQTDSILVVSPAPYNALSLIGFATEGAGSMNVTVRFTDNTTQVFNNIGVADWFTGGGNSILNGFGRTNRTSGTVSSPSGAPNLYYYDLNLTCANRVKNVKSVKIVNIGTNPRLCMMGLSGASNSATITTTTNPVTCQGGTNGSASVSISGGTPPFTYSWVTTPVQTGALANNLPVGTYSFIVTDAGSCTVTNTVAITQSLVAQNPLFVSSNGTMVCVGNTVALAVSGANTFTWSTGSTQQLIVVAPTSNTTYTVGGYSQANCFVTGSIAISVQAAPVVSISALPASFCINSPTVLINVSPSGGSLSGNGLLGNVFSPTVAGVGTASVVYSYTDANNCSASATAVTVVNPLPTVAVGVSTSSFCTNSPAFTLTNSGSPGGGTFSGSGVNGSLFTPGNANVGSVVITYSYTDANNCSNTATTAVNVYSLAPPNLSVAKNVFCPNSPNIPLSSSPGGGTFSGSSALNTNGVFSPSLAGVGTFSLTYSISSGVCTVAKTITVTVNSCAGLAEYNSDLFSLYPNPNNGTFTVKAQSDVQLNIYNQLGQLVLQTDTKQSGNNSVTIENLAAGVYIVLVQSGSKRSVQKVIINR